MLLLVGVAWVAVGLAGCAGARQNQMGKTLLEAGDHDRAVTVLEEAVKKDPGNTEYQDGLSDAKTQAADYHFEQAKKLISQQRPGEAKKELETALGYMPGHPEAITLVRTADEDIAACKRLQQKAQEAIARQDWDEAIGLADRACQTDKGDGEARDLLDRTRSAVVSRHLARAQMALEGGDSQTCLAECAQIRVWDRSNPFVAQLEQKANQARAASGAVPGAKPAVAEAAVKPASKQAPVPTPARVAPPPKPGGELPSGPVLEPRAENRLPAERPPPAKPSPPVPPPAPSPGPVSSRQPLIEVSKPSRPDTRPSEVAAEPQMPGATFFARKPAATVHVLPAPRPVSGAALASTRPASPAGRSEPVEAAKPVRRSPSAAPAMAKPVPGRIIANQQARTLSNTDSVAQEDQPEHVFRGTISRDDNRYSKSIVTIDGIEVKIKDVDESPLDADLEITVGKSKIKPHDVPMGGVVRIQGQSGRFYKLTILWINYPKETVSFVIDTI